MSAAQDWKRAILTPYQSEDPSPTIPTHRRKEEKGKNSRRQKGSEQLGQQKGIVHTRETRQSHTIKHRVTKIIPERYRHGNKSPAVLRGSAARRCIRKPMCDQSTTWNPAGTYGPGRAPERGCIGSHLMLYSIQSTATDRRCARSHSSKPPAKKNRHH